MSRRRRSPCRHSVSGIVAALALLVGGSGGAASQPVAMPEDYRMDDYRAPVPDSAPGATTLDTEAVRALIAGGEVVLIDVLPRPPRPAGLSADSVWAPKPRLSLPGAIWLPNVGFGALSEDMHHYFTGHLKRLAREMPGARLVFFCEPSCWMSWNAAKRAADWGHGPVFWYPDGTDGWSAAGLTLEPVTPEPDLP